MKNIIKKTVSLALVALGITAFALNANAEAVVEVTYVDAEGKTKTTAYATLKEAAAQISTSSDTTVKLLSDHMVEDNIEFTYGASGTVTFTSDKAITISQTSVGEPGAKRCFDFLQQNSAANIVVGRNVTFETYGDSNDFNVWYGANLQLDGTITGGNNNGALYLYNGNHVVSSTGTIGTGRVHSRKDTLTVNGSDTVQNRYEGMALADRSDAQVNANFLLIPSGAFTANDTYVKVRPGEALDGHGIYDTNKGSVQDSGVATELNFNRTKLDAYKIALSKATTKFNLSESIATITDGVSNSGTFSLTNSALSAASFTNAGTVKMDCTSSITVTGAFSGTAGSIVVDMTGATADNYTLITGGDESDYGSNFTVTGAPYTLSQVGNNLVLVKAVVKIGDKSYADLPAAFAAVEDGETITMVNNYTNLDITAATYITLAKGKAVTLDLAGYSIYGETAIANNTVMLQVNGDLTITDSSEGKTGYFGVKALYPSAVANYGNYLLYIPNGTVTLEAGTLENLSEGPACYVFQMGGESNSVTVNGGTARAVSPVARMFYYSAAPTMTFTLNGGLLESTSSVGIQYFAYSVSGRSAITVTGGEIKADKYGIYAYGTDGGLNVDISGGKITTANEDYSAICLYNYRPQAFDEPTSVNITGGTVVGSQFLMEVYDYYGVTQTLISDGDFTGKFLVYTYVKGRPDYCRRDEYCVKITGGNFTNFAIDEESGSWFYWVNQSAVLLYGGTYDKCIATDINYKGRVAEGYDYLDNLDGTWTVIPAKMVDDVVCGKDDTTTIVETEKPAEITEAAWETATNIVATATTTDAPAIVADAELTNAVEQAKTEFSGSTVLALWADVDIAITPVEATADADNNVIVIKTDVTPSLTTWAEVTNGETVSTNRVGEAERDFDYSGKYMALSFDVSEMTYEPILVIHRHDDGTENRYTRGTLPTTATFAYDAEAKTITLMMNSFSDVEIYAAVQVGETAYATISQDGLCTVTGTGDMWSYAKPNQSKLWEHNGIIKSIVIEDTVQSVGTNAFAYQKGVTDVTIGAGVTNVCEDAFFSCLNVTNLAVGAGVKTVGTSAFGRCNSLTDLSFGSKTVAEACQGTAFKIVARITMNGKTPVIDAVPKVTIEGYTRALYGAETLAGPWEKISNEADIPSNYHFFKYVYEEEQ